MRIHAVRETITWHLVADAPTTSSESLWPRPWSTAESRRHQGGRWTPPGQTRLPGLRIDPLTLRSGIELHPHGVGDRFLIMGPPRAAITATDRYILCSSETDLIWCPPVERSMRHDRVWCGHPIEPNQDAL